MLNKYLITRKLNHNVVIVKDFKNQEWILFGRGIGFNKKDNDFIDSVYIENKYLIFDQDNLEKYTELIETSDEIASIMSEWIIYEMQKRFGEDYNKNLHISLLDHLNFSLKRIKEKIVIKNLFENELNFIYPKEYEFSSLMIDKIYQEFDIKLPESEAGMIALHIHSALHNEVVSNTALIMNIVSFAVKKLETKYGVVKEDALKTRLIIHLKFAIKRALDKIQLQNDLNDLIKQKFKQSYIAAKEIATSIENEFLIHLNESEIVYLSMHLQNIFHFKKE